MRIWLQAFFGVALLLSTIRGDAQDTFSIIVYDEKTGEIASAGASCIDGDQAVGGAVIISSVHPGLGAVHTQSFYLASNQQRGDDLLLQSASATDLVLDLRQGDITQSDAFRQYLAFTVAPTPTFAAFTGENCYDWAGHYIGEDYAIAGNILLDSLVLDNMRIAVERTSGASAATRALAALTAVAYPGADRRCLSQGLSSRSAFLRLARPGDRQDALTLDLVVDRPTNNEDPITTLQRLFADVGN